jgi:hypothetical protein
MSITLKRRIFYNLFLSGLLSFGLLCHGQENSELLATVVHEQRPLDIVFNQQGNLLGTASADNTARILDVTRITNTSNILSLIMWQA